MNSLDPHSPRVQGVILACFWVLLALVVIPTWGWTYWDFGDGNYLYLGRRINEGLVPYRDILAPQPPLHLLTSAWAQAFGSLVFGSELIGARLFSLLVRMAQSFFVFLIARRMFACPMRGLTAAGLYLLLPIGFWWSICFQSQNLQIVFLLAAMYGVITLEKRWLVVAGVCSALAMHCNMTSAPYFLCNALFLAVRRPRLVLWYVPVALGAWGAGALAAYAWCGRAYIDNVVLNQVGSFPRADILALSGQTRLGYFTDKIVNEGREVLRLEGTFILAGLIAMATTWRHKLRTLERNSDDYRRWEYFAWYCIGMLLSIGFVMKGGTVNYIFVLGEPAVAMLGADALVRLGRVVGNASVPAPRPVAMRALAAVAIVAIVGNPFMWRNIGYTLRGVQSELPSDGVEWIVELIEAYTEPGDPILAPPFYAYATGRTVAGELAENYLWQIKWLNETFDGVEGEGVLKMAEVARMLRARTVPLLLLDMNQTGRVPVIAHAAETFYQPVDPGVFFSRHVPLRLMVPAGTPERPLSPPPARFVPSPQEVETPVVEPDDPAEE